jgi:fatty acid desaturase
VGNISVGVVNATTDGVAAGGVGGNPALLWSSLALSALSMAYGFYSGCARMDRVFSEKDETPPVVAGHRVWVFVGILVQVVWALAALGSVWGSALPPAVRLYLPLALVGATWAAMALCLLFVVFLDFFFSSAGRALPAPF